MKAHLQTRAVRKEVDKIGTVSIPSKNWISRYSELSHAESRDYAFRGTIKVFWLSVFLTFAIYFMHGFQLWGFNLPTSLLHWLGGASIGQSLVFVKMLLR
jgi:hypothetical protein